MEKFRQTKTDQIMDKPLQRIDHIMWDAESAVSLTTIAGMMVFKKKLSKQKLVDVVERRLLRFERFRRRVIVKNGKPMWHSDEDFELKAHIREISLPGEGTHKDLQKCISDLMSKPLDYERPLWDAHIISNYNGGCVLLWRLHHAVADGMSLVKVIFSLTGLSAKDSLAIPEPEVKPKGKNAINELMHLFKMGQGVYEDAKLLLNNPSALKDTLVHNWEMVKETGELLLGNKVAKSIYKGKLGAAKKAAWTEPLQLDTIKQIAKQNGVTINDVLVAMVAGAVREHLLMNDQKAEEGLKVVLPVNVRGNKEISTLHNDFSWMSFDLPVHLRSYKERIAFVRQKTAILKPTSEPIVLNELIHLVADFTPQGARQKLLEFMGSHIVGAITNVPGPKHPIYLAGQKVEDLAFWIPHTTPLGIGISLMSYNGKVYMGIVTDAGIIKNPDVITHLFEKELKKMTRSAASRAK